MMLCKMLFKSNLLSKRGHWVVKR